MSIDRNEPPEPPADSPPADSPPPDSPLPQPASPQRRPALADRQTLDRKTIDDSFERKRRELGFPAPDPPLPIDQEREKSAPTRLDSKRLDSRRRALVVAALLVGVSLTLGLLVGTCFGGSPEPPLEALGIGSAPDQPDDISDDASGDEEGLDPEQQAFAERRERELAARQSESEPGSAVPDFTDYSLVQELAGAWRLDLGRGRRGYRVRFGSDPVRKVHRERYDVTLFDVAGLGSAGRGLPPYFTVLDLPDGKLLAFLDASGTFRLVLEDVRRESDGSLSWRGPLRERRYGERLDGPSAWRFGGDREAVPPEVRLEPAPADERPADEGPADERPSDERPGVGIRPQPGPVSEDVKARLYDALERHLDELAFGLMERDADRIYALWGDRPDSATRASIEGLLERYSALRVWTRPLAVDVVSTVDGPQAHFEVVVTIQGAPKGARNQRDVDVRDIRWRGRIGLSGSNGKRGEAVQLDPLSS